jgi:signal transduction histidine kinase
MPDESHGTGTRRPVVLHVDDDEANRYAVSRSLRRAGFDVMEAANGSEALGKMASRPDLVVLDVRLPDIDGFEVCRRIKADPGTAGTPVLHLSASYVTGDYKAQGLDAGADAYLVRPVEPIELVATVKALLRQRRTEEALRESELRLRQLADERAALLELERALRREAEEANRLKDEFLATLSHELRTPLNAIIGWTTILQQRDVAPQIVAEGVATIDRNAKMQSQLIEDLLDVSRILSGKLRLDIQPVDLTPIVEAAMASVFPSSAAKQITMTRALTSDGATLLGDAGRLQQVIWNLLSNAIKFTPGGGHVDVRLERAGRHLELSVTDSGEGIPPEFLPYVFDRFRQADASTTRSHAGLGLGLAIVRYLVEQHGGTVEAQSQGAARGACFVVRLPIRIGQQTAADRGQMNAAPLEPSMDQPHALPELTGVRVLVVDDETDSRLLLQRLFEQRHAEVAACASVAEALTILANRRFDVVVSDIGMPGQDGYDLVRQVRSLPLASKTPAIALTAFARAEDRRRALRAGFHLHLAKPVDPAELLAAVAAVSGRRTND